MNAMMRRVRAGAALAALAASLTSYPLAALGQSEGAEIDYNLGLAAAKSGSEAEAEGAFERACLADEGVAAACLAWKDLVEKRPISSPNRDRDLKRALGSAVMLDPANVAARYELALLLIEKGDYPWAIEHLEAALGATSSPPEIALLEYYLGYAELENGALDDAAKQLALAESGLPADLAQRCRFYRALVAEKLSRDGEAARLFAEASNGPDGEVADAVRARREAETAFPRADGFRGQLNASLGMNTHPTAAAFDDPGLAGAPVLQSVFRGDLMFGAGKYTHGFFGALTVYREQSFTEIGPKGSAATDDALYLENDVRAIDVNPTHFMSQLNYIYRAFGKRFEHELRFGLDLELRFLDHWIEYREAGLDAPPCMAGSYEKQSDAFVLMGRSLGEHVFWSFAEKRASTWTLQLRHEVRKYEIETDRSANRFRFRVQHAHTFLDKTLQLKAYAGGFYDRTYGDPAIVKYDRLQSEASAELKWNTPLPHLSMLLGAKLLYHFYMNAKGNEANSFRPAYIDNPGLTEAENAAAEHDYYDLARRDFEWELSGELQFDLWKSAVVAVRYVHHTRVSNIDDAPRPMVESGGCGDAAYQRIPQQNLGYDQDIAALELRQSF